MGVPHIMVFIVPRQMVSMGDPARRSCGRASTSSKPKELCEPTNLPFERPPQRMPRSEVRDGASAGMWALGRRGTLGGLKSQISRL